MIKEEESRYSENVLMLMPTVLSTPNRCSSMTMTRTKEVCGNAGPHGAEKGVFVRRLANAI